MKEERKWQKKNIMRKCRNAKRLLVAKVNKNSESVNANCREHKNKMRQRVYTLTFCIDSFCSLYSLDVSSDHCPFEVKPRKLFEPCFFQSRISWNTLFYFLLWWSGTKNWFSQKSALNQPLIWTSYSQIHIWVPYSFYFYS